MSTLKVKFGEIGAPCTPSPSGRVSTEQADLMLDAGADINAETDTGWTPLDLAIELNRQDMIDHLRSKGAKTGVKKE